MGDVQIGNNELGRKRVGWAGGRRSVVVVTGMAEGRRTGGTIGCGACSQLARVEVRGGLKQKKKRERGGQRQKREKKEVKNKVSIHKEM